MPKHRAEVAEDRELKDTSYGSRFGPRLIQSGEWITEEVFLEEIHDLTDVDEDVIRKVYDAYNDLIMQHIALEDHVNLPFATIGGHTREPRKVYYATAMCVNDPTSGGYCNAKSGFPYFKWTQEALEATHIHPAIYFCEWVPQKYTTKAREFRKEVGYPEIPEYAGLPEEKITLICAKADKALYGNRTRRQISKAKSWDKQKKKQQIGTVQATMEEAKAWLRELGIPEDKIKIETYDDAQLIMQMRWRSIATAIEISKRRQANRFHSKQWIEDQKRMREKMDKDRLQQAYARNDIFRLEDLPEEIQDKMISVLKQEAINNITEYFEEVGHYTSPKTKKKLAEKRMKAIDRKIKDLDDVKKELAANKEYRDKVLEELYGREYYHDIIANAMDALKDAKGDSLKQTGKAIKEQSMEQDAAAKQGREEQEKSFFQGEIDTRLVNLENAGYMTKADEQRAKVLTNIYNSFIEKDKTDEEESNDNEEEMINDSEDVSNVNPKTQNVVEFSNKVVNNIDDEDDLEDDDLEDEEEELIAAAPVPPTPPKRRGRPPGSKNKTTIKKTTAKTTKASKTTKSSKTTKTIKKTKTPLKKDA